MKQSINGHIVDIFERKIYKGSIQIESGKIQKITPLDSDTLVTDQYILPGFIDAHIHIESSMLSPSAFAAIAVKHGTIATVSDPHEIANVCGLDGVDYMINDGKTTPFKFYFGAPSCVPATNFETAGAVMTSDAVEHLLQQDSIKYLSEMMNFPGVLMQDPEVMAKIAIAKKYNKPVDGHAPGLTGDAAIQYINAGITTDHECTTYEEAAFKLEHGMKILIREGSAAKNFDALIPLMEKYPKQLMFCSDDKHPDALQKGHINELVEKAVQLGYDVFDVLYAACILPKIHYNLEVGILRVTDPADFIIVNNLSDWHILATYIDGNKVADASYSYVTFESTSIINHFNTSKITATELKLLSNPSQPTQEVIIALDGQLITKRMQANLPIVNNEVQSDQANDILKIAVKNRYNNTKPAIGFIQNIGLKAGAIASSVAHDSHNIVAVGVDDESIANAINAIIENKGGICVYGSNEIDILPLPIAGLMSDKDISIVSDTYQRLDAKAKQLGSNLSAPFMTLSFMALPVIPQRKVS